MIKGEAGCGKEVMQWDVLSGLIRKAMCSVLDSWMTRVWVLGVVCVMLQTGAAYDRCRDGKDSRFYEGMKNVKAGLLQRVVQAGE